jgi:hypothetical protein
MRNSVSGRWEDGCICTLWLRVPPDHLPELDARLHRLHEDKFTTSGMSMPVSSMSTETAKRGLSCFLIW